MGGKGGGGSNVTVPTSPYEAEMARIASDMYNSTDAIRKGFIRDWSSILLGNPVSGTTGNANTTGITSQPVKFSGYVPGPNGIFIPADKSGYYADKAGNLYPGSAVTKPSTKSDKDPVWNLPTTNQNKYFYTDPFSGDPIEVFPSEATPGISNVSFGPGSTQTAGTSQNINRYDPTKLPTYEPLFGLQKQSLESQYQRAKQNILASTPTGGNLTGALSGLESSRAASMGAMPAELSAGILADMLGKAYGASFNAPQTSISGLGSAAGTYGNRQAAAMAQASQEQQNTYGMLGGVGQGIGKIIGGGGLKQ